VRESIECCDEDIFAYAADSDEVVSRARDYMGESPQGETLCNPMVNVQVTPNNATCVRFPVYVGLVADDPRAYILYTTDGSDPARDQSGSTLLYSAPILVDDPYTALRFMAVVDGCPSYPVQNASFVDCVGINFSWLCAFPDKVGARGIWVPDGNYDHNWNLAFDFDVFTIQIDQIDVLELDENLEFTTGNGWSTAQVIYPYPSDPTKTFSAFPLWLKKRRSRLSLATWPR